MQVLRSTRPHEAPIRAWWEHAEMTDDPSSEAGGMRAGEWLLSWGGNRPGTQKEDTTREHEVLLQRARWVLEPHGIWVYGIGAMGTQAQVVEIAGRVWDVSPISPTDVGAPLPVSPPTHQRKEAAERAGVQFDWFVYLSERPRVRQQRIDPILIGVICIAPNAGIWCELGRWDHGSGTAGV